MGKRCVDLFAGTGGFSSAFADSDEWDVTTVEINDEQKPDMVADVWELQPSDLPSADVVLASPPCTYFSLAGNHDAWDGKNPVTTDSRNAVGLVYHTLGLIHGMNPEYWFLENPRGRMRYVLGEPAGTVHYCQYGKDYKKPTDLFGKHPLTLEYRTCNTGAGGGCHVRNAANDGTATTASMPRDPAKRSAVPYELSEAILRAVEGTNSQQTLDGVAADG